MLIIMTGAMVEQFLAYPALRLAQSNAGDI
jgi:hypothetical protein